MIIKSWWKIAQRSRLFFHHFTQLTRVAQRLWSLIFRFSSSLILFLVALAMHIIINNAFCFNVLKIIGEILIDFEVRAGNLWASFFKRTKCMRILVWKKNNDGQITWIVLRNKKKQLLFGNERKIKYLKLPEQTWNSRFFSLNERFYWTK